MKASLRAIVRLNLHALVLMFRAQRALKRLPPDQAILHLANDPLPHFEPAQTRAAVLRAASIVRRLGLNSTCLPRSVVAGALVLGRPDTELHIGFQTPDAIRHPRGHSWTTLAGENISDPPGSTYEIARFSTVKSISLSHPGP